jgi:general secretion pathway protein C
MISMRSLLWMVNLAMLAGAAYGGGQLTAQLLRNALEDATPAASSTVQQAATSRPVEKMPLPAFQAVLDANMFKARRSELKPVQPIAEGAASAPPSAPAPPSTLHVMLTGTMIMGDRSFAMVADASGRNEQVYRLWDCLPAGENHPTRTCEPNQGKLVVVRGDNVVVKYLDERITLKLAEKPAPPPSPPPRAASAVPPSPATASVGGMEDTTPFPITREGNVMEVRVPNGEVEKAFENFSDVLKQARVVPFSTDSGSGFQIRNIRPGSIFQRIGLNNFDVIRAVNGDPITTADQALRLLTMFRNEKEITLDLQRRNEDIQLNYIIE